MHVFRVTKTRYDPLDPSGAEEHGARWNSPGRPALYFSECQAGSMTEILAHHRPHRLPGPHHCLRGRIPTSMDVERLDPDDLPGWDAPGQTTSRRYGDRWLEGRRTVALVVPAVPSAPYGRNVVLNPRHPGFREIEFDDDPVPVSWDRRLLER